MDVGGKVDTLPQGGQKGVRTPTPLTEEVFSALHAEHAGALFAFALRLSGNRERAEEVAQETLFRAWQNPRSVDGSQGSARAWLFTVARNLVTDSWRGDAARPRCSGDESLDLTAAPDEIDRAVESWGIAEALRRVTPEHRQVLFHSFYLGHSVDQTSLAVGIPAGTVKSRTYYALRALRAALEEMGYFS